MLNILQLQQKFQKEFSEFEWTVPPNLSMGVLSTNQAFKFKDASDYNSPLQYANFLVSQIQAFIDSREDILDKVLVKNVGPYINLDLSETAWNDFFENEQNLEATVAKNERQILIDFVSPNVGKPLHVGHLLQASFGEALRKILSLKYKKVVTESYWCDWGVPMGIIIWAWKNIGQETQTVTINEQVIEFNLSELDQKPVETLVKVYVWGNQQKESIPNWEELVRLELVKLEQGDTENRKLLETFSNFSKTETNQILELMNVKPHDYNFGEAYYENEAKKLLEFLLANQLCQRESQAVFMDLETLSDKWPGIPLELSKKIKHFGRCYLVSSLGYTTYALRDIAARIHWARDLDVDIMLNLVGNEQNHHFDQFFAIVAYLASLPEFQKVYSKSVADKLKWENLIEFGHGMVNLPKGKMSSRKGNFITAKEIINQIQVQAKTTLLEKNPDGLDLEQKINLVAVSSLKWFYLNKDILQDYNLNIPQILKFEGNTGIYQLYTLVRLKSVLNKNLNIDKKI